MKKIKVSNIYLITIFILMYIPIFYLIFYSFNSGKYMHNFSGFSLIHYKELFSNLRLMNILLDTLIVALTSSLISTIIGLFGALTIYNAKNIKNKNILLSINNILMVSPDVIIGASFLILFTMIGIKLGFITVLLAHIAFSVPIVVIMILPQLESLDSNLISVAYDLGANSKQVLNKIILPIIWSGIISGFLMALTYSLDDFAVTFFVTGSNFSTLSIEIYSSAREGINLYINALSAIMFITSLILVVIYYMISMKYNKKVQGR